VNRVIAAVAVSAPLEEMEVRACSITPERLTKLRNADAVVRRLSHESGYDHEVWQFPVILIPMGTKRGARFDCAAADSFVDGMTAQSVTMPADLLERMCAEVMRFLESRASFTI